MFELKNLIEYIVYKQSHFCGFFDPWLSISRSIKLSVVASIAFVSAPLVLSAEIAWNNRVNNSNEINKKGQSCDSTNPNHTFWS